MSGDRSKKAPILNDASFVDASLAQGLARQTVRQLHNLKWPWVGHSEKPRPAQRFKDNLARAERLLGALLVARVDVSDLQRVNVDSEAGSVLLAWEGRSIGGPHPQLLLATGFLSRVNGHMIDSPAGGVIVSNHALQRVLQRLRTTDVEQAMRELSSACVALWILAYFVIGGTYARHTEEVPLAVSTPRGQALGYINRTEAVATVTTWIDEAKLRPEQKTIREVPFPEFGGKIHLYQGKEPLPGVVLTPGRQDRAP